MSICYVTKTATGEIIRAENETYFDAARWCKAQGLTAADVLFSATRPRPDQTISPRFNLTREIEGRRPRQTLQDAPARAAKAGYESAMRRYIRRLFA